MNVYLDGVIVPWPVEWLAGLDGWVIVMAIDSGGWLTDCKRVTLNGNVTIVKMQKEVDGIAVVD